MYFTATFYATIPIFQNVAQLAQHGVATTVSLWNVINFISHAHIRNIALQYTRFSTLPPISTMGIKQKLHKSKPNLTSRSNNVLYYVLCSVLIDSPDDLTSNCSDMTWSGRHGSRSGSTVAFRFFSSNWSIFIRNLEVVDFQWKQMFYASLQSFWTSFCICHLHYCCSRRTILSEQKRFNNPHLPENTFGRVIFENNYIPTVTSQFPCRLLLLTEYFSLRLRRYSFLQCWLN